MAWALSSYLAAAGGEREAAQLLLKRMSDPATHGWDRDWLTGELALIELRANDPELNRRGGLRVVELVSEADQSRESRNTSMASSSSRGSASSNCSAGT